jgi:hypothetical protein|tara:strand:+ start:86 stop:1369 length:1284 start_codon:yes stop_codon:yes gene_type:complete
MSRGYTARDPRTGKPIRRSKSAKDLDIRSLYPSEGVWERIPVYEILKLASGNIQNLELSLTNGGGFARRGDGIRALHRVYENLIPRAHEILLEALDNNDAAIRIAALEVSPIFALKQHTDLIPCLSDRLLDESAGVRAMARRSLQLMSPVFPSGCEELLRRELRDTRKEHRKNAFETLRETAKAWPEVGCLHIDELLREEELDLRRRSSKILRTIATKGGAEGWDLIGWALEDIDAQVRRNGAQCLTVLANSEPSIAMILVESAIMDEDTNVRKSVIRALKKLDMENPRVTSMILDGARSRDYELRKACVDQLSIIMSGDALREAAGELLRHETVPELRQRLGALARDVELDGSEDEKNKFLAAVDVVKDEFVEEEMFPKNPVPENLEDDSDSEVDYENIPPPPSGLAKPKGEHEIEKAGRREPEDL